jgi:5-methyltetrahydrofolate--homocysteine methyltransferase
MSMMRKDRIAAIHADAKKRILVLDGSWGVMIQTYKLPDEAYRGPRFATWGHDLKGNNDLLCLTKPEIITQIADLYLDAGADIISTNSFTSTRISQADYGLEDYAAEISKASAELARAACDARAAKTGRPYWVAGSIGPLNRALSISPDVNDPGKRAVTFAEVYQSYREQALALNQGGADLYMIETVFDTLNAKAAIKAILDLQDEGLDALPIWISGTITDRSGRTLSGQTVEAFWNSIRHAKPFAVGLNCALGADLMRPYIADLSRIADTMISAHPNAGLPNEFGAYDETPHQTCAHLHEWAKSGLANILGGCCGTTPDHIRHIAEAVKGMKPRTIPERPRAMRLSGLEPFELVA